MSDLYYKISDNVKYNYFPYEVPQGEMVQILGIARNNLSFGHEIHILLHFQRVLKELLLVKFIVCFHPNGIFNRC